MSDENTAGSSYLASLKNTIAASAPRSPHSDPSSPTPLLAHFESKAVGSEKRRSPRYRCQGSAHLRENGSGSSTWATFTDISLHGIYVEAMSTFPVGARLTLILEANKYRIECRGEVRVVYPGLGMGLSFVALPEADRDRLRQLLASLSLPSVILTPSDPPSASNMPSRHASSAIPDPGAALRAILQFFEQRHILSHDEFLRILRKSQSP